MIWKQDLQLTRSNQRKIQSSMNHLVNWVHSCKPHPCTDEGMGSEVAFTEWYLWGAGEARSLGFGVVLPDQ